LALLARFNLLSHSCVDCKLENVIYTSHFLAAAFDVHGIHAFCDGLALLWGYRSETLGFEEVDAGAFGTEVGFEPNENEGRCGAEVENFRVPLYVEVR
jgi:hypothetical protein